jgi:hypothetical protein
VKGEREERKESYSPCPFPLSFKWHLININSLTGQVPLERCGKRHRNMNPIIDEEVSKRKRK